MSNVAIQCDSDGYEILILEVYMSCEKSNFCKDSQNDYCDLLTLPGPLAPPGNS